jgi:ABC-type nitrate/sulfonate/bicarbonate transport system permease component
MVTELMGAQQGMRQIFSMAMPMQALDLLIVGVLWITILAATTDLLFVWAARIVTRNGTKKTKIIERIVCGILQNTVLTIFSVQ